LRILKELFQKFLKRGAGAEPLPDKPKFEAFCNRLKNEK